MNLDDYEPVFSNDGESIVFTSERDGNKEIYLVNLLTKNMKNLTNDSEMIGTLDFIQIIKK